MTPIWSWVADAVLALLLIGTLGMVVRLDRAMRMIRQDRAVFEALISNLSSATNSVKLGIQALRNEADRAAEQIGRRSEDADKMATDLSFLIEAADRAGANLEGKLRSLSASQAPAPVEAPAPKLHAAARVPKRRRVAAATDATPAPVAPEPASAPNHAPSRASNHADELRELAGITTRPRVRGGVSAGAQSAGLNGPRAGEPAPAPRRGADLIKRVG